ncbi:hypothetical protein R75465_04667 [Paraburkholderia aspalathi]|nr:hypothetical protein R75465_04667 [Paraburkholderia aspalathi]
MRVPASRISALTRRRPYGGKSAISFACLSGNAKRVYRIMLPTACCLGAALAMSNPRVGTTSRILWRKAATPALCSAPIPDRRVRYADVISLSIGRSWSIKRNTTGSGQRAKHDRVRVSGPWYRCVYGRAVTRQTKACASRLLAFRILIFLDWRIARSGCVKCSDDYSPSGTVDIPGLMKTEAAHEIAHCSTACMEVQMA